MTVRIKTAYNQPLSTGIDKDMMYHMVRKKGKVKKQLVLSL